jgi:outer membrane lipoprotein-sorting protein
MAQFPARTWSRLTCLKFTANTIWPTNYFRIVTASCCLVLGTIASVAEAEPSSISARDLALRLNAWQQDGASYVRLRMVVKESSGTSKRSFQIQVKSRRTKTTTDVIYQILWPKERKGEAVLLKKTGERFANGWVFTPPDKLRRLQASQLAEPLFGSNLSYEDLVDNFFAWDNQAISGTENVDGVSCYILESKPGKDDRSSFAVIRTWVDARRLVPLRIEKYSAAGLQVRRIDTANVVTDDIGRQIPANWEVSGPGNGSVTELDGSRIKHDISYTDNQFTPEALNEVAIPGSSRE